MTWSLTIPGLPRAGEISKPIITNKGTKNEGPFEDMGFNEKTNRRFQTKEQKRNSRPFKNTQWNTRPLNATFEEGPGNQAKKNKLTKK